MATYSAVAALLTGLTAVTLLLAMVPVVPMCIAGTAIFLASLLSAAMSRPSETTEPDEIASPLLRAAYRDVIEAAYELSSRISSETAAALPSSLRQRARCVVVASGRLAQRTNQAYEYLYKHPPSKVAADIAQLKARAERTTDDLAKKTLLDAAAVRGRELATINAMLATSERVHARLDHAAATLRACTAAAVAAGSENAEFSLVQTTLDDRVDELGTELDVVEETTAETAASLDA